MKESISIQVTVANRTYSLKMSAEEEKGIQKASVFINERLTELQKSHGIKDPQDMLAMLALQLAAENLNGKLVSETEGQESLTRINALNDKASAYLNSL